MDENINESNVLKKILNFLTTEDGKIYSTIYKKLEKIGDEMYGHNLDGDYRKEPYQILIASKAI